MSTTYKLEKEITMDELFDRRFETYGVKEKVVEGTTAKGRRLLTDGSHSLWIYRDTIFEVATAYGLANSPGKIVTAIEEWFDTKTYSESDPEYWGFETVEECEHAWDEMLEQVLAGSYSSIMNYINGLPNKIEPGTTAMSYAEIAMDLIADSPALLSPEHEEEFMQEIRDRYSGIDVGAC